jgi:transposase InsO family protein
MNAIAERWIGGCRHELPDRSLIWNQNHLRQVLREYGTHHNQRRPHRSLEPLPR